MKLRVSIWPDVGPKFDYYYGEVDNDDVRGISDFFENACDFVITKGAELDELKEEE